MRKKVLICVASAVLLVGVFSATYEVRVHQLNVEDKKQSMNTEYVEEIDKLKIEEINVVKDDKEYTDIKDLNGVEAGTTVDCHIKLASGEEKDVEGYISYGDHTDAVYNGAVVKITLERNK